MESIVEKISNILSYQIILSDHRKFFVTVKNMLDDIKLVEDNILRIQQMEVNSWVKDVHEKALASENELLNKKLSELTILRELSKTPLKEYNLFITADGKISFDSCKYVGSTISLPLPSAIKTSLTTSNYVMTDPCKYRKYVQTYREHLPTCEGTHIINTYREVV
jgi:hypothetical protein